MFIGKDSRGIWSVYRLLVFLLVLFCWKPAFSGELHNAAKEGNAEDVKALLTQGAKVHDKDADGKTPLFYALSQGKYDFAESLLSHQVPGDAPDSKNSLPHHAVTQANEETAEFLIKHGAEVNARDGNDSTPLHKAAHAQNEAMAHLLLAYDADIHAQRYGRETPLHDAVGDVEVVKLLLSHGADVNAGAYQVSTPLHLAAGRGETKKAKLLLFHGAQVNAQGRGWTPLHRAAQWENPDVVALLLSHGAQVNIKRERSGTTPLHTAAGHGKWRRSRFSQDLSIDPAAVVKILLDHGAEVDVRNGSHNAPFMWKTVAERTPLHRAASGGDKESVELLPAHGADVNAEVNVRDNPNYQPRKRSGFYSDTVIFPDPRELGTRKNMTPLLYAAWRGHADVIRSLFNYGADVNRRDSYGRTPLHLTTFARRSVEAAKILIEQGAEVEARTRESGETPFHIAARKGNIKLAGVFLNHAADVNAKDRYGETPLIPAAATGQKAAVEFLLTSGADPRSRDIALSVAERLSRTEIAAILR